jgi:hypothetical protein
LGRDIFFFAHFLHLPTKLVAALLPEELNFFKRIFKTFDQIKPIWVGEIPESINAQIEFGKNEKYFSTQNIVDVFIYS